MIPFPNKKYNIIYADPPWKFNFKNRKGLSLKAKNRLYNTMNPQDILNLPVENIADRDCILFLWVINSELPLAIDCIAAWGFKYITIVFFWVKITEDNKFHFGGGNWTRSNPEICLMGKRGNIKRKNASIRNLIIQPVQEHSAKPIIVKHKIIELCGDLPRIELFAREKTIGWDTWGDQDRMQLTL